MPDPNPNPAEGDPPPAPPSPPAGDPPAEPTLNDEGKRALEQERQARKAAEKAAREQAAELEALRKEKAARDDAEKTELQKAQERAEAAEKRATESEARIRETQTRAAVLVQASQLDAVDPDAVYALLDKGSVEYGDDGRPSNVEDVVKALLKAKPYLVKGEGGSQGVPGTPKANAKAGEAERIEKAQEELRASGRYSRL